jgi:hypothetical protein
MISTPGIRTWAFWSGKKKREEDLNPPTCEKKHLVCGENEPSLRHENLGSLVWATEERGGSQSSDL